jgi:hypothetical protein
MQKSSESDHPAQRLDARAALLLVLHCNDSGEISPSLELAFGLVGPHASTTTQPTEILISEKLDGTGLLIRGRQTSIVWCSTGSLEAIKRIAAKFNARYAGNWSGLADLNAPVPTSEKAIEETKDRSSFPGFPMLLGLLLLGLTLGAGVLHADDKRPTLPLVRSGAALGDGLLERLATAAKTSGNHVEVADILAETSGIQLLLQGLVLTPPADHPGQPIHLPVVVSMRRSETLSVSFRAITPPRDSLPAGSLIRIVLRQTIDEKVIADQTTNLGRGWNTPSLAWIVDRDRAAGEFVVDIILVVGGPVKITLPQGLVLPAATK